MPGRGTFGFQTSDSKTDNFKVVRGSGGVPPPLPPLSFVGAVETNRNPFGVAIDSTRAQALVANQDSKTATLVDLETLSQVWDITVGRGPYGAAVNPVTNVGAVTLREESAVAIIDLATRAIIKVGVSGHPLGIAIDPGYNIAVVAVVPDTIVFIDLGTKTTPTMRISELTLGKHPHGVAVNPTTHVAAVTNLSDGSVALIDYRFVNNPMPVAVVALPRSKPSPVQGPKPRPTGVAFDYAGASLNRVLVADPGTGNVFIVTLNDHNQFVGLRTLGPLPDKSHKPVWVAVNPGADFGIVTTDHAGVFSFTVTNPAFTGSLDLGNNNKNNLKKPQGVAIDPVGCRAAVTNRGLYKGHDRLKGNVLVLGFSCSPVITNVDPPSLRVGTTGTLKITGSGLLPGTLVNVTDLDRNLMFAPVASTPAGVGMINSVTIVAPGPPGTYLVSVTVGGKTSNSLPITTTRGEPAFLCSVNPARVIANGADLDLTILGRNVVAPATAVFGGVVGIAPVGGGPIPVQILSITPVAQTTSGVCQGSGQSGFSNQRIQVRVLGYPVTVLTTHASVPSPTVSIINGDGAPTNALVVELLNPVPTLSGLQPHEASPSTVAQTLTLFGFNFTLDRSLNDEFTTATQVLFNGQPISTVVPDPSEPNSKLLATIPASLLTLPAGLSFITYNVSVLNPGPGGGVYPDPNNPPPPGTLLPTFTVVAANIPTGITVTTFSVNGTPAGAVVGDGPTVVSLFKDTTSLTGVVGIGNLLRLRLADLTNPLTPTLLPSPIIDLGSPSGDGLGDVVTLPGSQKAVAVTVTPTNEVVVVNFSVTDPLTGGPKISRYPTGSSPGGLAVDAVHNKLVMVNKGDFTAQVFTIDPLPAAGVTLSWDRTIDLTPALRTDPLTGEQISVITGYLALDPSTGFAAVLDSPDPPELGGATGAVIRVNYLTGDVQTQSYLVGVAPGRVAINPNTHGMVITEAVDDQLRVLRSDGTLRALVSVAGLFGHAGPQGIVLDPATNKAIVVNTADNNLVRVDLNPATPATSRIQIGTALVQGPVNVAWDPQSGTALASTLINSGSDSAIVVGGMTPAHIP